MKRAYITITVCVAVTALFTVPQVRGQSVMRNSGDARSSSQGSSKAGTSSVDDTTLKKKRRSLDRKVLTRINTINEIMRKVDSDLSVKAKFAFYLRQAADPSSPM